MNSAKTEIITDDSVMSFGQYKGQKIANVPASYLLWLYRNERSGQLKTYILENFEALEKEAEKDLKKGGKKW
ncbi:putative quorum-sensing-regulated virulence factor [Pedobacter agri]|uniref:putative quorum-sensing-regulated virulence factor n=1 Tax=Pedobacter agri TaxID=454586 RepID=UPI0029304F38|nr:DUF3820 family protein [Pedobacter agri]